jgi:hypothetical protein
MIILDSRRPVVMGERAPAGEMSTGETTPTAGPSATTYAQPAVKKQTKKDEAKVEKETPSEDVNPDDIPF